MTRLHCSTHNLGKSASKTKATTISLHSSSFLDTVALLRRQLSRDNKWHFVSKCEPPKAKAPKGGGVPKWRGEDRLFPAYAYKKRRVTYNSSVARTKKKKRKENYSFLPQTSAFILLLDKNHLGSMAWNSDGITPPDTPVGSTIAVPLESLVRFISKYDVGVARAPSAELLVCCLVGPHFARL